MTRFRRRLWNILRYGIGERARERKRADKAERRDAKFESERWDRGEDFAQRRYRSYDEYVSHQASKLDNIVERLRETESEDFEEFQRRFAGCAPLEPARTVLCLGARLGTEVRALHALGHFAVGIDLNPGVDNPYVLPGDFHNLVFPDGSVDAIYTNALDHVFDLGKLLAEVARLLRPGGLFVADVIAGFEEGFVPGEFEATHWRSTEALLKRIEDLSGFTLIEQRDLGHTRRDLWHQAVFRKPD
jgi:SAM-dependent methyltransferase